MSSSSSSSSSAIYITTPDTQAHREPPQELDARELNDIQLFFKAMKFPGEAPQNLDELRNQTLANFKGGQWKIIDDPLKDETMLTKQIGETVLLRRTDASTLLAMNSDAQRMNSIAKALEIDPPYPPEDLPRLSLLKVCLQLKKLRAALEELAQGLQCDIPYPEDLDELASACFEKAYTLCKENKMKSISPQHLRKIKSLSDSLGQTLFIRAINASDIPLAEKLAAEQLGIHSTDAQGNSALHLACSRGLHKLIPILAQHLRIDQRNMSRGTPLHQAILADQDQIVELLLRDYHADARAKIAVETGEELAALPLALKRGSRTCIQRLLDQDIDLMDDVTGRTGNVFHVAVAYDQADAITFLMHDYPQEMESHLTTNKRRDGSPLLSQEKEGLQAKADLYKEKIKRLLTAKNDAYLTPLILAAAEGADESIKMIIKHSELLFGRKDYLIHRKFNYDQGKGPVHHAAINLKHMTILLLSNSGFSVTETDNQGLTPISYIRGTSDLELSIQGLLTNLAKGTKVDSMRRLPPANLAFKGGGVKGIAYVGALECLSKTEFLPGIKRVAGTSAGAITSTLIAVGYSPAEIKEILFTTNLTEFLDHPLTKARIEDALKITSLCSLIKKIQNLIALVHNIRNPLWILERLWEITGICEGEVFRKFIEAKVFAKTGVKFCTFGELRKRNIGQFRHLHVYATKIGDKKEIAHFSTEDARWDDLVISDAVRASMSIPGVFIPHHLYFKDPHTGQRYVRADLGVFVDGGMLYNLPVETFDEMQYQKPQVAEDEKRCPTFNHETIGFNLFSSTAPIPRTTTEITNVGQLFSSLASIYFHAEGLIRRLNPYNLRRLIDIDVKDVGTLNFDLSREEKDMLIHSGKVATQLFIEERYPVTLPASQSLAQQNRQMRCPSNLLDSLSRDALLESIGKMLSPLRSQNVFYQFCNLYGEEGSGRTELAVQFAHRNRDQFSLIWWIPCHSALSYEAAYRRLAKELDYHVEHDTLAEIRDEVHRRLEDSPGDKPWLLIFDDWKREHRYPAKGGAVLTISTREEAEENDSSIPVEPFKNSEKESLIFRMPTSLTPWKREIGALFDRLSGSPLYFSQACGLLQMVPQTIEKFREVRDGRQVVEVLLGHLKEQFPACIELLYVCSFLHHDSIHVSLINQWAAIHNISEKDMDRILQTLVGLCLFRKDASINSYQLHRSTHKLLKDILHRPGDRTYYSKTVELLCNMCQSLDASNSVHGDAGEMAVLHVEELMSLHNLWDQESAERRCSMLTTAGSWTLVEQNNPYAARKYLQQAHGFCASDNVAPFIKSKALFALGNAHITLEQYEDGVTVFQASIRELSQLELKHPQLLAQALQSCSRCQTALGQYREAIDSLTRSKTSWDKVIDQDIYKVASLCTLWGDSLLNLNETEHAIKKYEESRRLIKGKPIREEHVHCHLGLSRAYQARKDFNKAKEELTKAQEAADSIKKEAPLLLASVHREQGNFSFANQDFRAASEYYGKAGFIRETFLSANHPALAECYADCARAQHEAANLLPFNSDKYLKCLEKMMEMLTNAINIYGKSRKYQSSMLFIDLLKARGRIGMEQGKYKAALEDIQKAKKIIKMNNKAQHDDVDDMDENQPNISAIYVDWGIACLINAQDTDKAKRKFKLAFTCANKIVLNEDREDFKKSLENFVKIGKTLPEKKKKEIFAILPKGFMELVNEKYPELGKKLDKEKPSNCTIV